VRCRWRVFFMVSLLDRHVKILLFLCKHMVKLW
jgi:hypothetical protein